METCIAPFSGKWGAMSFLIEIYGSLICVEELEWRSDEHPVQLAQSSHILSSEPNLVVGDISGSVTSDGRPSTRWASRPTGRRARCNRSKGSAAHK